MAGAKASQFTDQNIRIEIFFADRFTLEREGGLPYTGKVSYTIQPVCAPSYVTKNFLLLYYGYILHVYCIRAL